MYTLKRPTKADYPQLLDIWERSVTATHHFLQTAEISRLKSIIQDQDLFAGPELLCAIDEHKTIAGFIGTSGSEVDMLFIHPAQMKKGAGKMLLLHAIHHLGASRVDVNEQNKEALGFYENFGFRVLSRSEVDALGLPYPVLHMELATTAP